MNALRTVRRLDERSETKEIAGVVIESGIPVPPRVTRAVAKAILVLKALQVGESFVSHRDERDNRVRVQRECPGRKFVGRPIEGGKRWRLWRIA